MKEEKVTKVHVCLSQPERTYSSWIHAVIIEVKAPNICCQELGPMVTQNFTVAILAIC